MDIIIHQTMAISLKSDENAPEDKGSVGYKLA